MALPVLAAAALLAAGGWGLSRLRTAPNPERLAAAQDHYQRGTDLYQQGLYAGAQAELERARSLGLQSADLDYARAQVTIGLAGQRPPEERRAHRAEVQAQVEEILQAALKIDPRHVPSLMLLARLYDGGFPVRHLESLQSLERILAVQPERMDLRIQAGKLYQARPLPIARLAGTAGGAPQPLGAATQLELARKHLEEAVRSAPPMSPEAVQAQVELAWCLVKMGDYDRALAHAEIAQRNAAMVGEGEHTGFFPAGVAAYRRGDYPRAFRDLQRAAGHPTAAWPARWLMRLAADRAGGYPTTVPRELRATLRPEFNPVTPPTPPFRDVAASLGVAKIAGAAASAWGDVDNDGWEDLFVGGCNTFSNLFRFDGRRFQDVTDRSGLAQVDWGFGAHLVDYDNDKAVDLYVARYGWAGAGPHSLLKNQGDGRFVDVTASAGAATPQSSTYVSLAGDFDRDGHTDIFLCNGVVGDGSPNVLLHNNGNGTFSDWTRRCGLAEDRFLGNGTIGGAIGDYDDDGWPDLFLVGANAPNRLFRNRGDGRFEDATAKARVGGSGRVMGYMGLMADFNGDGRLDLLTVTLAPWDLAIRGLLAEGKLTERELEWLPQLYLNNGDGTFRNPGRASGFRWPVGCMGAQVGDLDNDGALDLIFGTGDPSPERLEPMRVYRNQGNGTFEDVSWRWGLTGGGKGHGITVADFDHDGRLDIYAPFGGYFHCDETPAMLYHNRMPLRPSLWVRLIGTKSNRDAIGARLTLKHDGRTFVREVTGPRGFGSTSTPWVNFGLPGSGPLQLVIRWPSGVTEQVGGLKPNTRLTVTERQGITSQRPLQGALAVR